eukprot:m.20821 g.20821  ORF g.20821 m.20821 type:complete len:69 (+) comp3831_c0_seq2:105-311(+)
MMCNIFQLLSLRLAYSTEDYYYVMAATVPSFVHSRRMCWCLLVAMSIPFPPLRVHMCVCVHLVRHFFS